MSVEEDMLGEEIDAYTRECEIIRQENKEYLKTFRESLEEAGLSQKTIRNHVDNVDFYINVFLLRYDAYRMPAGTELVSLFLGDFFIRKCMWSSPSSIKQNIASLKKFYQCMLFEGNIDAEAYESLLETIKEEKDDWIAECEY